MTDGRPCLRLWSAAALVALLPGAVIGAPEEAQYIVRFVDGSALDLTVRDWRAGEAVPSELAAALGPDARPVTTTSGFEVVVRVDVAGMADRHLSEMAETLAAAPEGASAAPLPEGGGVLVDLAPAACRSGEAALRTLLDDADRAIGATVDASDEDCRFRVGLDAAGIPSAWLDTLMREESVRYAQPDFAVIPHPSE